MLFFKIALLITLTVWLVAMISTYQYGRIGRQLLQYDKKRTEEDVELPPLSVIIAAHNQAPALRRHLPSILNQDYDRFEVIVIDMASTDETKDVLERLEMQNAHLRHTYTPASARDISIERLALTLGFRAAIHEWVVITRPDCEIASPRWLMGIGKAITHPHSTQRSQLKEPDMILGSARYDEQRSTWFDYQIGFYRLWNTICRTHHILDGHSAISADSCNLAFRKNYFMECGGFSVAQNLEADAIELLVNHTSKPTNTALMLMPSSMVIQDRIGSPRLWKQERVFYAETQRYQRHTKLYRFKQVLRMLIPWSVILFLILPLLTCAVLLASSQMADETQMYMFIYIAILSVLLLIYIPTKLISLHTTTHALGCRSYYLSYIILELLLPFQFFSTGFTHHFSSHNEFRKKFI